MCIRDRLQLDDVITHFRGREIRNSSDLRYAVGLLRPDTLAKLTYIREGVSSEIDVITRAEDYVRPPNPGDTLETSLPN